MSSTGLPVFDETIHLTNSWLREIMDELHADDRQLAYRALRAVLHAVRDRLDPVMAAHFGAQLPMLVRGFFFEGWHPGATAGAGRHLKDFYAQVAKEMHDTPNLDPARVTDAVLGVVSQRLPLGTTLKVTDLLPHELRNLWRLTT
ncbi:MAG TPA: DUF2267 domain-containing protein [Azospirillum sp.]